jgi:uncharacterized UBP type Zn finger protein
MSGILLRFFFKIGFDSQKNGNDAEKTKIVFGNQSKTESGKNYLFDHMDPKMAEHMKKVRLGEATVEEYEG